MTNQTSGEINDVANEPSAEHPSTVQGNIDSRSCPPIEVFHEPDPVPRPSISNSRNSNRTNGKSRGKRGGDKRFMVSGGNSKRRPKKEKPKKSPNGKTRLKRFSSM